MLVQRWLLLTLTACSLSATGCQSTSLPNWKFWQQSTYADRMHGLKDPVQTHIAYGRLQEQTGNFKDARESYQIALEGDGKSVEAILGLARLDVLGGRPKEAEKRFEQALQMAPQNVHVLETTGQFFVAQGRYDEALSLLQRAVDIDGNNKRLRFRLAVAQARSGDIRAAEQNFVQATGVAEADYNIGVILYENGNLTQAEQRLQRALLSKPSLTQAQQLLADIQGDLLASRIASPNQQLPSAGSLNPSAGIPAPESVGNAVVQNPVANPLMQGQPTGQQPFNPYGGSGPLPPGASPINPAVPIPPPIDIPVAAPSSGTGMIPPTVAGGTGVRSLDISRMNAAQLEQLENSMSPIEREQFRNQLRLGQTDTLTIR